MSGSYNAGGTPGRVVLVDPTTLDDYNATGSAANPSVVVGNVASGATDSGAPVKVGGVRNTTLPTLTAGQRGDMQLASDGSLRTLLMGSQGASLDAIPATNIATVMFPGTADSASSGPRPLVTAPHKYNGTTWDRDRKPSAVSRIPSSANTTNATSAKASAGDLCNVTGYNSSATVTYLKFYNKASAPTVGTDTPFVTVALAPTATFSIAFDSLYFSTGIAYGLTTDAADAGTTAVAAGAILGLNVVYA